MKEIIKILVEDHQKIANKLSDLDQLLINKSDKSLSDIAQILKFFNDFTFRGHHLREDEVLYAWMRTQNPNSDTTVMDRIKSEHDRLEKMCDQIQKSIESSPKEVILSDVKDFITLYFEHMEKEEKFIFMIAEGLGLCGSEKEAMLLKMRNSLS